MENSFKPTKIIGKGYLTRLLLFIFCIFIIGSSVSALYLYLDIYKPLSSHYSAVLSIITEIRDSLLIKSIKITAIFYLLILAGIVILGIIYSHRIAGPLYRIKLSAKSIGEGRLDTNIKFRRNDTIHSFANVFNEMTENYNDMVTMLNSEIQQLKVATTELKTLAEKGEDTEIAVKKVLDLDSRVKDLLKTVKL